MLQTYLGQKTILNLYTIIILYICNIIQKFNKMYMSLHKQVKTE